MVEFLIYCVLRKPNWNHDGSLETNILFKHFEGGKKSFRKYFNPQLKKKDERKNRKSAKTTIRHTNYNYKFDPLSKYNVSN